jgi:hypothetical protein
MYSASGELFVDEVRRFVRYVEDLTAAFRTMVMPRIEHLSALITDRGKRRSVFVYTKGAHRTLLEKSLLKTLSHGTLRAKSLCERT